MTKLETPEFNKILRKMYPDEDDHTDTMMSFCIAAYVQRLSKPVCQNCFRECDLVHHMKYRGDNYKKYGRDKTARKLYQRELFNEINQEKLKTDEFVLLCWTCHNVVHEVENQILDTHGRYEEEISFDSNDYALWYKPRPIFYEIVLRTIVGSCKNHYSDFDLTDLRNIRLFKKSLAKREIDEFFWN